MRARMQGGVLARNFTEFASLFIAWKISEKPFTRMSVCLLRQDNRGVGSDADVAAAGHPIPADLAFRRGVRRMIAENGAVTVPVTIEPYLPQSVARESNRVGIIGLVGHVDDHHNVVTRAAAIPAMKSDYFSRVIYVKNVQRLALQSGGVAEPIAAQANHVPVHRKDAAERLLFRPVQRLRVAEISALQELLPLKDHRNARGGENEHSAQGRALLRKITSGITRPDFFGNTGLAVGVFVVGLGVDNAFERIGIVVVADGVTDGISVSR